MQAASIFGALFGNKATNGRLNRGAVKAIGYLGQPRHGRKTTVLLRRVDAQGTNVFQGPSLEPRDVVPGRQFDIGRLGCFGLDHSLVKAGR